MCTNAITHCNNGGVRTPFATYGCIDADRMYFATSSDQETLFMGFNGTIESGGTQNHIVFDIRNSSGAIVYTEMTLPASGTGFINNIGEARIGPLQIYGAGGYTAIDFHPPSPGLYYIEFAMKNNSSGSIYAGAINMNLIDLTIQDTITTLVKPGRLYSKSWQFYENGGHYSGTNYVYSIDSIITSAAFNNMQGGIWVQFCNQWGCANTSNFAQDRKSLNNQQALLPQYRIFVNPPDSVIFPHAQTLGQVVSPAPWGDRFCNDGHMVFHVTVNKAGAVEIDLNFAGPYTTRVLTSIVTTGENLIYWDGKDGSGTNVPNDVLVTFTIKYINGLTNLPLYDVEGNPSGFTIGIVSPPGATPLLYWDDTNITGPPAGTANLTGCLSPPGCHVWAGSPTDWGDHNTINSWWYNVSSSTLPITINEFRGPQPLVFNQQPPQNYCAGTSGVIFSVIIDPNASEYHWSYTGTGATIIQNLPSDAYITVNFAANATSGDIKVYGTNTNCNNPGQTNALAITIVPLPSVDPPYTTTICSGVSPNIILSSTPSGSSFSWTLPPPACSANITPCPAGQTNATVINDILSVSDLNSGTVTYYITPSLNSCIGAAQDIVVTVSPLPDVVINSTTPDICSGGITHILLTSTISGTVFNWTATASSLNVTGFAASGMGDILQTISNSGLTTETVTFLITPDKNGCFPTTPTSYVVTVYPIPGMTITSTTPTVCSGQTTNINMSGTFPMSPNFTWTATSSSINVAGFSAGSGPQILQTLVSTSYVQETVTYHINPEANGCNGSLQDYTVIVFPAADLTNSPASKTICNNLPTGITLTSHVAGTLFTWACTPSSANITGWADNTIPTVILNQTLVNSGFALETVTYHIIPHANGCDGPLADYVVTIDQPPMLTTSPLTQTICTQNSTTVNLTSNFSNSTYTWTCSSSSPNLTGWANGSGNQISQILTNSGFTIETVTYHITVHANGCNGPVANYVVTVNPRPDVSNNPMSSQICSGTSPNVNLTSNVTGANFSWTATGSSPNVIGFGPGSGLVINQVLTNLGLNPETVTYHITPTANGCTGQTVNYIVTIVQIPDVYFNPTSQTICSQQTTNIQNLSHVVGTTFTWTASASSGTLSGFSAGTGNIIAQTIINSGATIETVTYTVFPSAFGCPSGTPAGVIVSVNPKPLITNTATNAQICNNASTNIVPVSTVTGTTYTWTATGSSPNVTGYSSGSGLTIVQTLQNTGFTTQTVTYAVTPHANSCSGNVVNFMVTVSPVADVYFSPASQTLCSGQNSNIAILSHVSGATFSWTASGSSPNVSGFTPGSGSTIQQTLLNSGYMVETVTYQVIPATNGCTGTSGDIIVTVDPAPVVTFTSCWDQVTTTNAKAFTLKGGIPLGGSYSGSGVNAGVFYPGIAGIGTHTITYTYTNGFTCTRTANQTISETTPTGIICGNTLTDIRDNQQYPTVQIGTQCWTAANLNYGNTIVSSQMQRDNCIPEKYCLSDNPVNCSNTGGLYQWDEMMKFDNTAGGQGFCPPGWHVPIETEWTTLFNFYISNGFAGSPLKYTGYSGFNAFLSGVRHENVIWDFANFAVMIWSSTSHGTTKAWAHGMNITNPSVSYYPSLRDNGFAVRCLKD